jgi:hypothetical protein
MQSFGCNPSESTLEGDTGCGQYSFLKRTLNHQIYVPNSISSIDYGTFCFVYRAIEHCSNSVIYCDRPCKKKRRLLGYQNATAYDLMLNISDFDYIEGDFSILHPRRTPDGLL